METNHEGGTTPSFQATPEYFDEQQGQAEIIEDHLPIAEGQVQSAATWAEECLFALNVMMGETGDFVSCEDSHVFGQPIKKGVYGPPNAPAESLRAKYYAAMERLADALTLIASFANEGELEADDWHGSWGRERRSLRAMFDDVQRARAEYQRSAELGSDHGAH